jgi:hypothetical protein
MNDLISKALGWYDALDSRRKKVLLWSFGVVLLLFIGKFLFNFLMFVLCFAIVAALALGIWQLVDKFLGNK